MKKPFRRPPTLRRRPVQHVPTQTEPTAANPTPGNKRFVFKGDVLERIGVSYPCLWRWMRDGKFPVALEVGGRCAWLESEIDDWMLSRPLRNYKSRQLA